MKTKNILPILEGLSYIVPVIVGILTFLGVGVSTKNGA